MCVGWTMEINVKNQNLGPAYMPSKFVSSRRVTRLPELSWKRQRFTHFFTKHGEPFKLQKVGSARRVTHLVQSPFCNGRVSLLAGPKFLRRHFTRFPFNKNSCLEFRKKHLPSGRYIPVAQTKPKPPRVWLSCL